jgi:hypothetical protein
LEKVFLTINDLYTLDRYQHEQQQQQQRKALRIVLSNDSEAEERNRFAAALDAAQQKANRAHFYSNLIGGYATTEAAAPEVQRALAASGVFTRMQKLLPDDALLELSRGLPGWQTRPLQRAALTAAAEWLAAAALEEVHAAGGAGGAVVLGELQLSQRVKQALPYVREMQKKLLQQLQWHAKVAAAEKACAEKKEQQQQK